MSEPTQTETGQLFANPAIATVFTDHILATKRNDGVVLIRCMSQLQEGNFEQARLILTLNHAKQVIDLLARLLDHYPTKPEVRPARNAGSPAGE